ncbi:MAG TPA: restriction endonuclease [Phenylobacterium sp.]
MPELLRHQTEFVEAFLARNDERTLLAAAPGTGKTTMALEAARRLRAKGLVDRILLVAGTRALAQYWGARSDDVAEASRPPNNDTLITTYHALSRNAEETWSPVPPSTRWLLVFDDIDGMPDGVDRIAGEALARFPGSRALFLGSPSQAIASEARSPFNYEFFGRDALAETATQFNLKRLAPSIGLLERIERRLVTLDDLSWREFEELIAQMLEADGYEVELTRGSKDGGVDVVAIKDLGEAGLFKSVWQAKKNRLDRKVGLSVVRELADTRLEHAATKAMLVTTSYLTSGAIERVERDRFLLGKIDRDDLDTWVKRILRA